MEKAPLDKKAAAALETRAAKARRTMGEICRSAGVAHSTWSRAKVRGTIRSTTLDAIESAVARAMLQTESADDASYIYALADPDGRVRYVGRTSRHDMSPRMNQHRCAKTALGDWVREVQAQAIILETVMHRSGTNPGHRERFWIEHYRAEGADLFNVWPKKEAARG